jgi:hypothetical protein
LSSRERCGNKSTKLTRYQFCSRSTGVIGPFKSEQMTPPIRSIGQLGPLSLNQVRIPHLRQQCGAFRC